MQPQIEPSLIQRIRDGDERAFEQLFREHYPAVVGFVRGLVRSGAVAEELVQEAFLRIWQGRLRLDPGGSVRAYLYRVARNQALNHLRHERVERSGRTVIQNAGDPVVEQPEPGRPGLDDLAAAIERAVASLPPGAQNVFRLSREHGLTYGEIAETLGVSIKTVETQMGRALKTLRARLAHLREAP